MATCSSWIPKYHGRIPWVISRWYAVWDVSTLRCTSVAVYRTVYVTSMSAVLPWALKSDSSMDMSMWWWCRNKRLVRPMEVLMSTHADSGPQTTYDRINGVGGVTIASEITVQTLPCMNLSQHSRVCYSILAEMHCGFVLLRQFAVEASSYQLRLSISRMFTRKVPREFKEWNSKM